MGIKDSSRFPETFINSRAQADQELKPELERLLRELDPLLQQLAPLLEVLLPELRSMRQRLTNAFQTEQSKITNAEQKLKIVEAHKKAEIRRHYKAYRVTAKAEAKESKKSRSVYRKLQKKFNEKAQLVQEDAQLDREIHALDNSYAPHAIERQDTYSEESQAYSEEPSLDIDDIESYAPWKPFGYDSWFGLGSVLGWATGKLGVYQHRWRLRYCRPNDMEKEEEVYLDKRIWLGDKARDYGKGHPCGLTAINEAAGTGKTRATVIIDDQEHDIEAQALVTRREAEKRHIPLLEGDGLGLRGPRDDSKCPICHGQDKMNPGQVCSDSKKRPEDCDKAHLSWRISKVGVCPREDCTHAWHTPRAVVAERRHSSG